MAADELTPEINDAVLEALKRKIQQEEAQRVAEAQGSATYRGLSGSSYEAIRTGLANQSATGQLADVYANAALQKAQMQREERLTNESRAFTSSQAELERQFNSLEAEKQRAYASGEAEKARGFEEQQNQLARQAQESAAAQQAKGAALGGVGSLVGNIGSAYITGLFGKKAATGVPTAAGAPAAGATGIPGAASSAGAGYGAQALGGVAGLFGGGYAGQNIAKLTGKNTNEAKFGSAAGASLGTVAGSIFGGPAGAAIGGTVGGALGGATTKLYQGIGKATGLNKPVNKVAKAVRSIFCFFPDTPIVMINGWTKPIKDIVVGDETKGGRVISVREAETDNGTVFDYQGVKVTGHHAVKESGVWKRIKDSPTSLPLVSGGRVFSIVTERHRVYVPGSNGIVTFSDETETDYYEELSIDESLALLNKMEEAA